MRSPLPRPPLPRAVLLRLESGRLVLLSLLLGLLVGALCVALRLGLGWLAPAFGWLLGYAPPGTAGEGGLLMEFGRPSPWLLLILPLAGAAYTWLVPAEPGGAFAQLVQGYHNRGQWPDWKGQARTLGGSLIGYGSGLLVGRDSLFALAGQLGTRLLGRWTTLDTVETRTLMLSGAAAALGTVLHAPVAAAVLVTEILYRRFEFEFEVVMPCLLASVVAYAVYGLAFGFGPLLAVTVAPLAAPQLPAVLLLTLALVLAGTLLLLGSRLLPAAWVGGRWRPALGAGFGLLTALLAYFVSPGVLADGSGWAQVALGGFLRLEALSQGLWRWVLLAVGLRLAFGGGVLPSLSAGVLLGVGLGDVLGLPPALAGLIGAATFLTVMLNVPVAATLLVVAWAGEGLLPAALVAAGLAHLLSGEPGAVPGQVRSRAQSSLHRPPPLLSLPDLRPPGRRSVEAPAVPYDAPAEEAPLREGERELYRRAVPRSWQGASVRLLSLPPGVEVIGVLRGGEVRVPRPELLLTADDELIFLAPPDAYAALEGVLRLPGA